MADDTTAPSYWLNWRFLLCAIWILVAMVFSAFLIRKNEGRRERESGEWNQEKVVGCLYEDEVWGTCSRSIHPIWLLAYRILAFSALLAVLLVDLTVNGAVKYYFYTEWTFTLVTIYFGLGSSLSILGSRRMDRNMCTSAYAERGSYVPPQLGVDSDNPSQSRSSNCDGEMNCRATASVWGYIMQVIFQVSAGAVMLTDSVFWLVLYPSLIARGYRLSFLIVCKHSVNAILLLGDAILNRLRFPFFRVAYFLLWTCMFVIFQWIIHACVSIRWPYPFLDLSSPYAPLWYLGIGLLAFLCYSIYFIIFRVKQRYLSR